MPATSCQQCAGSITIPPAPLLLGLQKLQTQLRDSSQHIRKRQAPGHEAFQHC
jgi:hypothetical protein